MNSDWESKMRSALEMGKPLIEALLADLEREAALIKERDLDPRKLATEPKVQEARSSAVEALEYLAAFAKSFDGLVKTYASDIDQRVDVEKLKTQLAAAPAAGRAYFESKDLHGAAESVKLTSEDLGEKVASETEAAARAAEEAAHRAEEEAAAAAVEMQHEAEATAGTAKVSTTEMLTALGWLLAAGAVVYAVLRDEKRRRQAKSIGKAAGSGLIVVMNSASKKDQ